MNKKLENYWYYYKWHTFAGIFLALLALITIKDCASRIDYDINGSFISNQYVDEQLLTDIISIIESHIDDLNEDGMRRADVFPITYSDSPQSESDVAIESRILLEFTAGEGCFFITTAKMLQLYSEVLYPINELLPVDQSGFGIKISELEGFKQLSLNGDDLYFAVSRPRHMDRNDEKRIKKLEAAKQLLLSLYSHKEG